MDSILENQRRLHEERERIVDAITKEFIADKKGHKAKINSDHRARNLLERYERVTQDLEKIYRDDSGQRATELAAIAGPNEFAEFYSRLKSLKDNHRRNPDEVASPLSLEFQEMNEQLENLEKAEEDLVRFTDEEGYGRFLDLHSLYTAFINLKGVKPVDYLSYIALLDKFAEIPKEAKKTGAYKAYLGQLEEYLVSFVERTRPLHELKEELAKVEEETSKAFKAGTLGGWSKPAKQSTLNPINLASYSSPAELETLGLEALKQGLLALGLKCGGTLSERAERLFATKGHKLSEMEKKALKKDEGEKQKDEQRNESLAKAEERVKALLKLLEAERESTKENSERKQARAAGEAEEDVLHEEEVPSDEDDYDDSVPYNPKNLPLGWDGKPIPYWLYKLHGLNHSFTCEICGNQSYKGPKAFQRHFTEWRHSHGMRCLAIPNTPHFANITKIADAVALWQSIKVQKEKHRWNAEADEEFEDSAGNVVSRRIYEDLKRQGLL